jgi:hypothetical protein
MGKKGEMIVRVAKCGGVKSLVWQSWRMEAIEGQARLGPPYVMLRNPLLRTCR